MPHSSKPLKQVQERNRQTTLIFVFPPDCVGAKINSIIFCVSHRFCWVEIKLDNCRVPYRFCWGGC
jgi:hypothetical protein